jgi:hypothetical protein
MKQVSKISIKELDEMAQSMYGNFVKAVVDVNKELVVVDAPMHVDEEQFLLEQGSTQGDLWGINLHPAKFGTDDFMEFDSMINIRPRANNMSRSVQDPEIQQKLRDIISELVHE